MACQFEIFLHPDDRKFMAAVQDAFDEVDRIEQQLSIYRPESEISIINRTASEVPVRVERSLYDLLKLARRVGTETAGAFDITTGALTRCWGFLDRKGRLPDPAQLDTARAVSGWHLVEFADSSCSVFFRNRGVELNLGGIGKGYALDRAGAILLRSGLRHFLMHAGQSSILAFGDSNHGPGWEVSVRNPGGAEGTYGLLRLRNQAMSTSGSGQQYFTTGDQRFGHILDPRTGRPAMQNLMASVVAPDATLAEALSTAFFVMDRREVLDYRVRNPAVGVALHGRCEGGASQPPLVQGITLLRSGDA